MARIAFVPAILLCTFLLIFSSTFPCGRYIEDRPLTSSFLYFLVFVVVGFISVWINKKHACLLFALHVFTGLSAICLVYTTSTSCPYVFTNPSLSDISITVISDYFRNYTDRTDVLFDPRYTGGSFRFIDGEVVTDLMRTIEHPRTTPWRVAPLVPSLAKWNRTDPVMAWAVCPLVHFFPDSSKDWKNRNLREGFLLFSDQWKLGAIKDIAREMRVKTPEIVPVFQWRDIDEAFNYAVVYLVMSNAVVYFGLLVVCMGTWYYKYRVLDPQTDRDSSIRGSYLLQDLSHTPWYGSNK